MRYHGIEHTVLSGTKARGFVTAGQSGEAPDTGGSLRDRILHAAFSLFMERGYSGTSTLAIATRTRVSKRDIYALFVDKRAILAVGIAERVQRMLTPLELPPARSRKALVRTLRVHGAAVLRGLSDPAVTAVYRLAIAEGGRSREVAQALDTGGRQPNQEALTELLARARASGLLRGGDSADMAGQFYGLLLGNLQVRLLLRVADPPGEAEIEARAGAAADALLALYGKRRTG
jgi:AcrR family transcriptional regulator